jgi:type II secretory pathway component PulF
MMDSKDVEVVAASLGNQLAAGVSIRVATKRMMTLQPKYKTQWAEISAAIDRGDELSTNLKRIWPENLVSAVTAGEFSGKMVEVFKQIEDVAQLQQKIEGTLKKLLYPFTLISAGVGVFLFFMIYVLPSLKRSLSFGGNVESTGISQIIFDMSTFLSTSFVGNEMYCTIGVGLVVALIVVGIKSPETKRKFVDLSMTIPHLKQSLSSLYFGIWAHYVALLDSTGMIDVENKLLMPAGMMPSSLQEGVHLAVKDIRKRGLGDSVDPEKQEEGDPRKNWPFYIGTAFIIANETGRLDQELLRVAPSMLKEGFMGIEKIIKLANIIALVIAGFFIALPLAAYYMQMGASLKAVM